MEFVAGPNRWRIQDDTVHLIQAGVITEQVIQTSMRLMDQVLDSYQYVFVSADASQITGVDPPARKAMAGYPKARRIGGTVTFGASFSMRAFLTLIFQGARLLGRADFPSYYPKTESDGLIWISELREKLGQRLSQDDLNTQR